jgi:hypothetical protein
VTIIDAINDPNLFQPFLGDLTTWEAWLGGVLPAIFGLPIDRTCWPLVRRATRRRISKLPPEGFKHSLALCGRRSGKSKIAGLIAAYLASMSGLEKQLSRGERGFIATLAPTKEQAEITRHYIRGAFQTPLLNAEVVDDNKGCLVLSNGVEIRTFAGSFRTSRGYTLLGAVVDEICYFRHSEECEINAQELIRALRPALMTINGSKLIAIGSKYSRDGWAFDTWKGVWESGSADAAKTLVWDAVTTEMNPTISQTEIDEAMAEDPESGRSEFLNEWREDIAAFIPRSVIEAAVVKGRIESVPRPDIVYTAFIDMSGGRLDDAGMAIGHRGIGSTGGERKVGIIDKVCRYKPPFDPYAVIADMASELKRFGIRQAKGDRYSAEFTRQAFRSHGIAYLPSEKSKSDLYLEALPVLCGGQVELPDNPKLIEQFCQLERKTRSGGRDIVDHPRNGHDDLSNVVCGVIFNLGRNRQLVGGIGVLGGNGAGSDNGVTLARRALAAAVSANSNSNRSVLI